MTTPRNYASYGGAGSWQNMNMTPDLPAAARAALANYALGEGTHLDGVFAVDPFALQALMEVTGPIRVPGAGTISADNVVDVTTNRVYTTLPGATQRKDLLGSAAAAVFARFLGMDDHGLARLRAISGAVADGHLRIYSTDPTIESGLTALGAGGDLAQPGGDIMGVSVVNGSGSKVDYYANRTVDFDIQLGGTGEAISTATVTVANDAPTSGQPRYVPGTVRRRGADGRPDPADVGVVPRAVRPRIGNAGRLADQRDHRLGERRVMAARRVDDPGARDRNPRPHLALVGRVDGQLERRVLRAHAARTADRPAHGHVGDDPRTVGDPHRVDEHPMAVDGGTATWRGTPTSTTTLGVRFQAPLPLAAGAGRDRPVFG